MLNFTALKVLTIILPILFLIAVDVLRHGVFSAQLHSLAGFIAVYALVVLGVTGFSQAVFGHIERLRRQLLDQNRKLTALNQVANASAENLALQQLLEAALDHVLHIMNMKMGVICTLDQEQAELSAACWRGLSETLIQRVRRAKLSEHPIDEQIVRGGKPLVMERIFENPLVSEAARREGLRSTLSVPLRAQGEVTGILAVLSKEDRHFSPDEIELLTGLGSHLGMVIRNSVLYERVNRSNRELLALLAVGSAATASLQLDELLGRTSDAILEATEAESIEIWLVEGSEVALAVHRGAAPTAFLERTRFQIGQGFPGIAVQTGSPVITHDLAADVRFLRDDVKAAGFQTLGAWPLVHQGNALGVLVVGARSPEALTKASDLRLIDGIKEQLAISVDNAFLYRRVQDAAIVEERERIAREMHDGMAQVLGYLNTQVLALRKLVGNDSKATALQKLEETQGTIQQLYAEVRENILGLRSSPGDSKGLVPSLETFLERYRSMAGFQVLLDAPANGAGLGLTGAAEVQLMRIVQEALSNVRKHAHATEAVIRVRQEADALRIEISDNGIGFDQSARLLTGWPRFGLQTMRERAEAVGGAFEMQSVLGKGTSIVVKVPVTAT